VTREQNIERVARLLAISGGFADPDALVLRIRTPWFVGNHAFEFITEYHKPEPGWRWFCGQAAAVVDSLAFEPLDWSTEPVEDPASIDPELPGFNLALQVAEAEVDWHEQMGLK
jgi:hypothetical protein